MCTRRRYALLVATCISCGDVQGPTRRDDQCPLVVGDLVISEFMVDPVPNTNPATRITEISPSWIEFYNASGADLNLSAISLRVAGVSAAREFQIEGTLTAGEYFVVGGRSSQDSEYVHLASTFSLARRGGVISVDCSGIRLDEVGYGARGPLPSDSPGQSLFLDGRIAPSAGRNGSSEHWCRGTAIYDGANKGTPGGPNTQCPSDDDSHVGCGLSVGDIVISELMIDPADTIDPLTQIKSASPEWVELYNASSSDIALSGLQLAIAGSGFARGYQLAGDAVLSPAQFLVVGGRHSSAFEYVDVALEFRLNNSGGTVSVECDGLVLDAMGYGAKGPILLPPVGQSLSFDGADAPSAAGNDRPESWCAGNADFDGVNLGTPGEENAWCVPDTVGRSCTEAGVERNPIAPEEGDLIISEVLADPSGADADREYIELFNASGSSVDLNDLTVISRSLTSGNERSYRIETDACVPVSGGEYTVIGHSTIFTSNGGLTLDFNAGGRGILYNHAQELRIERTDGTRVDIAELPEPRRGIAQTVNAHSLDVHSNDSASDWCDDVTVGLFDDLGSPGEEGACAP